MLFHELIKLVKEVQGMEDCSVSGFRYFPETEHSGQEIRVYFSNGHSTLYRVRDLMEMENA